MMLKNALLRVHPRHIVELISRVNVQKHGELNLRAFVHYLIESKMSSPSEVRRLDDADHNLPVNSRGIGNANHKVFHVCISFERGGFFGCNGLSALAPSSHARRGQAPTAASKSLPPRPSFLAIR